MSMFGNPRPSGGQPPQSSRTRRQNIRGASPGPSSSVPSGAGLFAPSSTAAGKAPATGYTQQQHRERDQHYQQQVGMELTQDQKEEINDAVTMRLLRPPYYQPMTNLASQFNLFDLNQDRRIDYHELKVAMKALGFDTPKPELTDILRRHGVLASGQTPPPGTSPTNLYITYEAFLDIMTQKIAERDPMAEIGRAFDLFAGVGSNVRQDGREPKIGIDDLRRVAKELGENLEEEELQAMIEEFDLDNDGMSMPTSFTEHHSGFADATKVSRDEFIAICKGD
jgi:centrin-3